MLEVVTGRMGPTFRDYRKPEVRDDITTDVILSDYKLVHLGLCAAVWPAALPLTNVRAMQRGGEPT